MKVKNESSAKMERKQMQIVTKLVPVSYGMCGLGLWSYFNSHCNGSDGDCLVLSPGEVR